jgi:DMSO/TMAO reductase YedYZ molybdopterin-dependent catalytic subunit
MIVPWAYGFKSIKWLRQISLTNDYQSNDTYAAQNNDPDSPMKTAAYFDSLPNKVHSGRLVYVTGQVISGYSGLERIEYWLQKIEPEAPPIRYNDEVYRAAEWKPCQLEPQPDDWSNHLPKSVSTSSILGFDRRTGRATSWPFRYGSASWQVAIAGLQPGIYEVRVRAVDSNGFAQPEPRPILKAGKNGVEVYRFEVVSV